MTHSSARASFFFRLIASGRRRIAAYRSVSLTVRPERLFDVKRDRVMNQLRTLDEAVDPPRDSLIIIVLLHKTDARSDLLVRLLPIERHPPLPPKLRKRPSPHLPPRQQLQDSTLARPTRPNDSRYLPSRKHRAHVPEDEFLCGGEEGPEGAAGPGEGEGVDLGGDEGSREIDRAGNGGFFAGEGGGGFGGYADAAGVVELEEETAEEELAEDEDGMIWDTGQRVARGLCGTKDGTGEGTDTRKRPSRPANQTPMLVSRSMPSPNRTLLPSH